MKNESKNTGFQLSDHLTIIKMKDGEHYQYRGKKPLGIMLGLMAKHFMGAKMTLAPKTGLIAIAKDHTGRRWVMNRGRVNDRDVAMIIQDEKERASLWDGKMNVYMRTACFYNPWRENEHAVKVPTAIIKSSPGSSPMLTALDCSADEAAGLIHEILALHILGCQPHYNVVHFASEYPVRNIKNPP